MIEGCGHELGSSGKIPGVVWTGSQGFAAAGAIPHCVIIPQKFCAPCFFLGRKKKKNPGLKLNQQNHPEKKNPCFHSYRLGLNVGNVQGH